LERIAMIKQFEHVLDGRSIELCATFAPGPQGQRVMISLLESARVIVAMEASGVIGVLKSALEAPEALLDHAVHKAGAEGLIDRALQSGESQTGSL